MEFSSHYGYIMLRNGEALSLENYAFTYGDIKNMDHKDYLGAEGHKHNGLDPEVVDPTSPLMLTMEDGGNLPSGTTVRYKYTWVDPYGAETSASPESTVTTPSQVATPGRPTITANSTGGTLLAGNYFYAISAYASDINHETAASPRAYTTILSGSTNSITIEFPSLPSGADGWNIYARYPGGFRYLYLDSVDMTGATPPTEYEDDGSTAVECNRIAPSANNTNSSKKVTIDLPGATPSVPEGYTWKIYRTYEADNWDSSLLHWVVEETSEGSGIIVTEYEDLGLGTSFGTYPRFSQIPGSPTQIQLTDAEEIQGVAPTGVIRYPHEVVFTFEGTLIPDVGSFRWRMPFEQGEIYKASATLGVDSVPAVDPVQIDVQLYHSGSWDSVSTTPLEIAVSESSGDITFDDDDNIDIVEGDYLTCEILQAGGGATPTDENLTIQIILWIKEGSATQSLTF